MNTIALTLSKCLTDFLEQNEIRYENLAKTNREIQEEQKKFGEEFETVKQREEVSHKDLAIIKTDLERMEGRVHECQEWVKLITALTQQVQYLNETKESQAKTIEELNNNQIHLKKQLEKLQRHVNVTASTAKAAAAAAASASAAASANNRPSLTSRAPQYCIKTPSRSPSTGSFFGTNISRHQMSTPRSMMDADDALSEMSDRAERLMNGVEALNSLNEMHHSFDRGSNYSGE